MRRTRIRERGLPLELVVISDLTRALSEQELMAWQRLVRVELNGSGLGQSGRLLHVGQQLIKINRFALDTAEVTAYQISTDEGGTLFLRNGTTPIATIGDSPVFITYDQGQAGVKFKAAVMPGRFPCQ